jgi:2,4-dienoyl-CoA reductase-like NADH-dependent reductase (Old Yellow Enzyme family)
MSEDVIFTPLRFHNLEVKNRIFRSNISGRFDHEDSSLTQTRINWECKFAKGDVGAIISSYAPVLIEGRIIAGYGQLGAGRWRGWQGVGPSPGRPHRALPVHPSPAAFPPLALPRSSAAG